ncbi:MAG: polyhydroxyalkanoate depolymerase [Hyphomicrobiales bacterium]|nr:polyhydroxyalkanoate depolymerase [Hyphomicrobiales bacterium]
MWYEATHALLGPARALAGSTKLFYNNPVNPLSHSPFGRGVAAACEMFERTTRRYGKPEFGYGSVNVNGVQTEIVEDVLLSKPFCNLVNFRKMSAGRPLNQPKILMVAPMSGHYATLLRGTVETFLPTHDVYITDWVDARTVPLSTGRFDLDDYIDYVIDMIRLLGPDLHLMAVCQPSVPVIAAIARMEAEGDPATPLSMTLMGGPIDTRESPTKVNLLAQDRGTEWFKRHCIVKVPLPNPGFMRDVYPGFLQLSGFMAMNIDRHIEAHGEMFSHLVHGDGDSAEKHRDFYDEYLAVMDLTAEFYLQTVDTVFVRHALPNGEMMHRDQPVDLTAIKRCALMTVEGENDDISGVGQTRAAHKLCVNIPETRRVHWLQPKVGHYGVFNGSRFRAEVAPRIADFMANSAHDAKKSTGKTLKLVS